MTVYPSPVELVSQFHLTYGQPIRTEPVFDVPEKAMRHDLIDEEIDELSLAFATYDFVEVVDALADIVYVVCGAGLTHGVKLNVHVAHPLVPGSFPKELLSVEPFTDVERKAMAALWDGLKSEDESGVLEQFSRFRDALKSQKSDDVDWLEIYRKLAERKDAVGEWFESRIDNTVTVLNGFISLNEGLHSAVGTDELRSNWSDLVALSYKVCFDYGVNLDVVLEEVQASNLSKLAADGSVLRREDGKVLKGPNFFSPDIRKVLESEEVSVKVAS